MDNHDGQENGRSCDTPPEPYTSTDTVQPQWQKVFEGTPGESAIAATQVAGSYPSTTSEPIAAPAAYSTLPRALWELRVYVLWHLEPGTPTPKQPNPKPKKVPTYLNGGRRGHGIGLDTPEDRSQLAEFKDALPVLSKSDKHEGIGFAAGEFAPGQFLQFLDFDSVKDMQAVMNAFRACGFYTEPSPSGKGIRVVGAGRKFENLYNEGTGIEAYSHAKFGTLTGWGYGGDGELYDLADFVEQRLTPEHARLKAGTVAANPAYVSVGAEQGTLTMDTETYVQVKSALNAIPADHEGVWTRVLYVLKPYGNVGRGLFMDWSTSSVNNWSEQEAAKRWATRESRGDMTLATIFGMAQKLGWVNPNSNEFRAALGIATQAAPPPPQYEVENVYTPVTPLGELDYPPGMAGALAKWIYSNAPRPVKEVGIAAALGWLAGVCGKAYVIDSKQGLDLKVILIAPTGIGKEQMHGGVNTLTQQLFDHGYVPAPRFIKTSANASGPALGKFLVKEPSVVHLNGEFGRKLERFANPKDTVAQGEIDVILKVHGKSGPDSVLAGADYSMQPNVPSVAGVNYSMVGETTPGTFYAALTDKLGENGFLPRFFAIEYLGERPPANKNVVRFVPKELINACGQLVLQASTLIGQRTPHVVPLGTEAQALMDAFDKECDKEINGTGVEFIRQIWTRAHLKALVICRLLACADSNLHPVVSELHAKWAIEAERRELKVYTRKHEGGDIGSNDATRLQKLKQICVDYMTKPVPDSYRCGDTEMLKSRKIIHYRYIEARALQNAAFKSHPQGALRALDETMRSMLKSGHLQKIPDQVRKELELGTTVELFYVMGSMYE